jgi:photosystem II stability/assembly factor-like uncharacterized protein
VFQAQLYRRAIGSSGPPTRTFSCFPAETPLPTETSIQAQQDLTGLGLLLVISATLELQTPAVGIQTLLSSVLALESFPLLAIQTTMVLLGRTAAKEDGSIIVAVGNDGADGCTARSLDGGATWSAVATPFGAGIFVTKIAWNGSVFCAVAFSGEVYTSSDGSSWSLQDTLAANLLWDIVARLSDGIMVIVGDDGGPAIYASSDDGATWTEATTYPSGFTNQIVRVAGCDSGFVVIEDGGNAYSSSADGLTWAAPVACPDNPGGATFFDDAEASRADSCVRATKFADYAFIFAGDDATAVSTPFFHFSF